MGNAVVPYFVASMTLSPKADRGLLFKVNAVIAMTEIDVSLVNTRRKFLTQKEDGKKRCEDVESKRQ